MPKKGFPKGRGTLFMLYRLFADFNQITYIKGKASLLGVDLKKAFGSVDIFLMTFKLIKSGIVGSLARLVHDYL